MVCFFFEGFDVTFFAMAESTLGGTILCGAFGCGELTACGGVLRGRGGVVLWGVCGDGGGWWEIGARGCLRGSGGIGVEREDCLRLGSRVLEIVLLCHWIATGEDYVFVEIARCSGSSVLLCR